MKRAIIAGGVFATVLVLLALAAGRLALQQDVDPVAATSPVITTSTAAAAAEPAGFLSGRITTNDGAAYEGRLRWGGDQEAFWGDYFNGTKDENPWVAHVPHGQLRSERRPIEILGMRVADWMRRPIEFFGVELAGRERRSGLKRPFMARFGDIVRVEAHGADVRVTLKSGTVFVLDRLSAGDFDDGVRVWDGTRGVVDLGSRRIHTIEFLPAVRPGAAANRLHGTVHTGQGDFTGFLQWNRRACTVLDELAVNTADGELSLPFGTIRSISRRSPDRILITLLDGREMVSAGTRESGYDNRGAYVDDRRYGRVLISWDAFERVDFSPGGSGPAYGDFPPGRPLAGSVTTGDGRRLTGRLVFDLDESETTETLDAPSRGVDYTIPFSMVASIVPSVRDEHNALCARVTLQSGEMLPLECAGDLGEGNSGMLIFVDGSERPEYVPWADVEQVNFHRPPEMYPPLGGSRRSDWVR